MRTPTQVPDLIRETSEWWTSRRGQIYMKYFIKSTTGRDIGFTPDSTPENVGAWHSRALYETTPYWISGDMAALTWHAHKTLPDAPLHESDLASPAGFAYLQYPLAPFGKDPDGNLIVDLSGKARPDGIEIKAAIRAIHWTSGVARNIHKPNSTDMGVTITVYAGVADHGDDWLKDEVDDPRQRHWNARDAEEGVGELIPVHMLFWTYGTGFATAPVRGLDDWNYAAYTATMWLLMQQRIAVTRRAPVERHARRRGERAGFKHSHEVNVITLRRELQPLESNEKTVEPRAVDWSCRWIVGGHWHQYHTKDGLVRRYVGPYMKGPENKPLKFTTDVYAWRR